MQRKKTIISDKVIWCPFDFEKDFDHKFLDGVDCLIHCAYEEINDVNKNAISNNRKITLELYEICLKKNIHFVFFSTLSAHAEAVSSYGKIKFELEQAIDINKACILKLGLIMGKGGLFTSMLSILKSSPIVPIFDSGVQPVQPVFWKDFYKVITQVVDRKMIGLYHLGFDQSMTMKQFLQMISSRLNKKVFLISLPLFLVEFALKITNKLKIKTPINYENVLGLKCMKAFPTSKDLAVLGVELSSMNSYLDELIQEEV
jgi:dTDP-4-dehydrorhamnose reductase